VAKHVAQSAKRGAMGDRALLRIALSFLACLAVLYGLIVWLGARTQFTSNLMLSTATAATALINFTGVVATRAGTVVRVPGRELVIGPDCTGLSIAVLLIALILSYPVKVTSRVIGALVGVFIVLLANLVRLVAIAHVSPFVPDVVFAVAHDFLFQVGMIAVAIGVWVGWLAFARAREQS